MPWKNGAEMTPLWSWNGAFNDGECNLSSISTKLQIRSLNSQSPNFNLAQHLVSCQGRVAREKRELMPTLVDLYNNHLYKPRREGLSWGRFSGYLGRYTARNDGNLHFAKVRRSQWTSQLVLQATESQRGLYVRYCLEVSCQNSWVNPKISIPKVGYGKAWEKSGRPLFRARRKSHRHQPVYSYLLVIILCCWRMCRSLNDYQRERWLRLKNLNPGKHGSWIPTCYTK